MCSKLYRDTFAACQLNRHEKQWFRTLGFHGDKSALPLAGSALRLTPTAGCPQDIASG
jgi:hypothetical protein